MEKNVFDFHAAREWIEGEERRRRTEEEKEMTDRQTFACFERELEFTGS